MRIFIAVAGIVLSSAACGRDNVVVSVIVHHIPAAKREASAFSGVGGFAIYRGKERVKGSDCPDVSNSEGKLSCVVACDKADLLAKPLRVVPPTSSKAPRVTGFIAPPSAAFTLKGCAASPSSLPPIVFRHASVALAELFEQNPEYRPLVAKGGGESAGQLVEIDAALPVFRTAAATQQGRKTLASFDEIARTLASASENPAAAERYGKYSVGINNVLLNHALQNSSGMALPVGFRLTGDKTDFYRNLGLAERSLDMKADRTVRENFLLNDIQRAKRSPVEARGNSRLYRLEGG